MSAHKRPDLHHLHRERIDTANLINRLQKFANGELEMEKSQVTAALGLLKKTLPDLQATELRHDTTDNFKEFLMALDGKTRGLPSGG